jgi:hypothetical protein
LPPPDARALSDDAAEHPTEMHLVAQTAFLGNMRERTRELEIKAVIGQNRWSEIRQN